MALEDHDREDLLRDACAMVERGECCMAGRQVVVGFRDRGQLSLYCGPDPVFQFNADRQLRRAYFQGRKIAADQGQLVEVVQKTRGGKVELVKVPVDQETRNCLMESLKEWLSKIDNSALWNPFSWQFPEEVDSDCFRERLIDWLAQLPDEPEIADAPNV